MTRKILLLIALLITDIVLFGAIVRYLPLPRNIDLQSKIVSAVLAHWFLLGFWLSFGGTRAPWRQGIVTSLLVLVCAFAAPLDSVANMAAIRGLLIVAMTWFFYAAMFFPRRLLGLRIGWDEWEKVTRSKSQFGLRVLLGFMVVISVPLAFSRLAFGMDRQLAWLALWETSLLFTPTCVIMLPFGIAIFATQNRLRKLSLSLLWVVAATFSIKHFHPPTAGGQINWEALAAIVGLIVLQVIVTLAAARLMGLHWLGTGETHNPSASPSATSGRKDLQFVLVQLSVVAMAILSGLLILFGPDVLQFVVAFILMAAAPFLFIAHQFWRHSRPGIFWIAFFLTAAIPWFYAMFISMPEAWTLLLGTPTFASTAPVKTIPTSGLDWPEVIAIQFAPLAIGAVSGVVAQAIARSRLWLRRPVATKSATIAVANVEIAESPLYRAKIETMGATQSPLGSIPEHKP